MNEYTPEKVAELVAEAWKAYADDRIAHWVAEGGLGGLADALIAVSAELRQERERAKSLKGDLDAFQKIAGVNYRDKADEIAALSRAEETIDRIRVARANHPECDVRDADDPVTCGWKRAVQDIDVALSEYSRQKEADRG